MSIFGHFRYFGILSSNLDEFRTVQIIVGYHPTLREHIPRIYANIPPFFEHFRGFYQFSSFYIFFTHFRTLLSIPRHPKTRSIISRHLMDLDEHHTTHPHVRYITSRQLAIFCDIFPDFCDFFDIIRHTSQKNIPYFDLFSHTPPLLVVIVPYGPSTRFGCPGIFFCLMFQFPF
jgi:hypothetical protein